MDSVTIPRLVIAGSASGVGKTTFTVGLIRALRARGLKVAAFKCGPDYLDPTYHARAAGGVAHNLDGWMMGRDATTRTLARASAGADIAIIEGMMGLYDGASPRDEQGSTAELAKWLAAPVLLVLDAAGIARTVAAVVRGFTAFDRGVNLAGVICNRVGSRGHLALLRQAQAHPPILGAMPADNAAAFPERHLGLRTAADDAIAEALFIAWGETVGAWCELAAILAIARAAPALSLPDATVAASRPRCRIGIAFDAAFHFYYDDNLRALEAAGAELTRFSPLRDSHLPKVDGLYLGGGYPEVHAAALAANRQMRSEIEKFARDGGAIYAECGGLMYLCSTLRTLDGEAFPMCGIMAGETTMCERLQALGYVEVETIRASLIGPAGTRFRGHQFRYSTIAIAQASVVTAYAVTSRYGDAAFLEGYQMNRALGSYVHAHWASNPAIPAAIVAACAREHP